MTLLLSAVTGLVTGALFTALKLPLPAPIALEGILGIAGMYVGYKIMEVIV